MRILPLFVMKIVKVEIGTNGKKKEILLQNQT